MDKLEKFIKTTNFYQLNGLEQWLLKKQMDSMIDYALYLGYRLDFYHIEH